MVDVSQKQHRMSYHGGSNEDVEGPERSSRSRRIEPPSRAFSTSTIHLAGTSSLRSQQPGRPKGFTSNDNVFDPALDNESSPGGLRVPRPNSLESSRSASNSSSPVTLKGSSSYPPVRTESMSSEDLVPTKDSATLPRDCYAVRSSSTLMVPGGKLEIPSNRNSVVSYNQSEKRPPSRAQSRPRSGSPGSEMVSLEEFLEESNRQSPPTEPSSNRDDLLGDYFKRSGEPQETGNPPGQRGYRDSQTMPANYLSSSVAGDGRMMKPGQFVKPSPRQIEMGTSSLRRLQPTQQPITTPRQTPEPQHPGGMATRGNSLSRVFSLATADLLKANGPDMNRIEKPELEPPSGKDFNSPILRTSTPTGSPRDRPQSVRMPNLPRGDDLRSLTLDNRYLSVANSSQDRTLQSAPPSGSFQQQYTTAPSAGRGKPRPTSRFGEVAMISPVRQISSIPEAEGQTISAPSKPPNTDCPPPPPNEEEANKSGSTKSTPASPDPNADPQSVWYEYGCV